MISLEPVQLLDYWGGTCHRASVPFGGEAGASIEASRTQPQWKTSAQSKCAIPILVGAIHS